MGPWEPITFRSGRTYTFPFRLFLTPIRELEESMVRAEFAYVAENLLLRGGYRKTHFQADRTTLQAVSQMGKRWQGEFSTFDHDDRETFLPRFTLNGKSASSDVFPLKEFFLQTLIRQWLSDPENLQWLFSACGLPDLSPHDFEILGEKALSAGHVDIFIKDIAPCGLSRKLVVEVKRNRAQESDVSQLRNYLQELGEEALRGILIASDVSRKIVSNHGTRFSFFRYFFEGLDPHRAYPLEELRSRLCLEPLRLP